MGRVFEAAQRYNSSRDIARLTICRNPAFRHLSGIDGDDHLHAAIGPHYKSLTSLNAS